MIPHTWYAVGTNCRKRF